MAEAIGGMTGSLQGRLGNFASQGQSILNRIIPPETRSKMLAWISKFAHEKPQLFAFIISHIALSGIPLGLFITLTISVAIFALIVALILALLGTILFIVFVAGLALIFLLPTLFITTAIATFLWLWGMGTYYLIKWFNEETIPGIHVPLGSGLRNEADEYASRGEKEGYGQDWGSGSPDTKGNREGAEARKKIEGSSSLGGNKSQKPPKLERK